MRPVTVSPEVAAALEGSRPVVALESTVIAHGLPYPRNIETARRLERIAREHDVVPATVAVLDGELRAGIGKGDIERLARGDVAKVSRRDLGWVLSRGLDGATTVSATMVAAYRAGIEVFATGGIGGVHRGSSHTGDVSADLYELGRTPVLVVSAGVKAMLDLSRTAELLETLGVPVVGFRTDELPAFYSRSSGVGVALRADSVREVADLYLTHRSLGLEQGVLVANPIPVEHEIPAARVEAWIESALALAREGGVTGRDVTPFLLARLVELSGGATLEANIRLLESNVSLACEIARAVVRVKEVER